MRSPWWDKLLGLSNMSSTKRHQPLVQIFRSFIGFQMNVSEVDEMGASNLESEMLPDGVPDGLD